MPYIFAYGSLMHEKSRNRTISTTNPIPVRIHNLERYWVLLNERYHDAPVAVREKAGATCNGFLIKVSNKDIKRLDDRECDYQRVKIKTKEISPLCDSKIPNEEIWGYVFDDQTTPDMQTPIAQSYIDLLIAGSLTVGREFAIETILSSNGWNVPWVNDRPIVRPTRDFISNEEYELIDSLLKTTISNFECRIELENTPNN